MSLNKAIEHGKEWRKPYCRENGTYAKAVSKACRNHGRCMWCLVTPATVNMPVRRQEA